eukprot:7292743-Pyramimonas_sp.AAC.1
MVSRNQARSSLMEDILPENGPTLNCSTRTIWRPSRTTDNFLCGEKVPQMRRGQWMQKNAMMRNGLSHSRTDDIVVVLNEELKFTKGSVAQRLYSKLYVDPWIVFWATCKPDSEGSFGGNLTARLQY